MVTENKGIMQGIAVFVEQILRKEYGIKDRGGLGGIIDADCIRAYKGAYYYCMAMVLIKYYSDANSRIIDKFIEEIYDIKGMKMDDIENKRAKQIYEYFSETYDRAKGLDKK